MEITFALNPLIIYYEVIQILPKHFMSPPPFDSKAATRARGNEKNRNHDVGAVQWLGTWLCLLGLKLSLSCMKLVLGSLEKSLSCI